MAPGVNKGHDWPIWYNSVHLGPTPGAFWGICLSLQIVPKFVFVFRHVRVQFLCVAFVIGHRCLFTSCDFMEHSRPQNRCSVKVTKHDYSVHVYFTHGRTCLNRFLSTGGAHPISNTAGNFDFRIYRFGLGKKLAPNIFNVLLLNESCLLFFCRVLTYLGTCGLLNDINCESCLIEACRCDSM